MAEGRNCISFFSSFRHPLLLCFRSEEQKRNISRCFDFWRLFGFTLNAFWGGVGRKLSYLKNRSEDESSWKWCDGGRGDLEAKFTLKNFHIRNKDFCEIKDLWSHSSRYFHQKHSTSTQMKKKTFSWYIKSHSGFHVATYITIWLAFTSFSLLLLVSLWNIRS